MSLVYCVVQYSFMIGSVSFSFYQSHLRPHLLPIANGYQWATTSSTECPAKNVENGISETLN